MSAGRVPQSPRPLRRRLAWGLVALLSLAIAGYSLTQAIVGAPLYPEPLRDSFLARPWGIRSHSLFGALALAIGPFQFLEASFARRPALHRKLGWLYMLGAFGTGVSGLAMSWFAYTGAVAGLGFAGMALALVVTTALGLAAIRRREVERHRYWMLHSFALIFAAVTFRLWAPLLALACGDFGRAYPWIAWVSWVPNLAWARWHATRASGSASRSRPA
jgi:uncharacterized membrane protein